MKEELTIYRVIYKKDDNNKIYEFCSAHSVAIFMLGRIVSNYIVVKSDANGDRVVNFHDYEITAIEKSLIEA
jgi:hypothetical protein